MFRTFIEQYEANEHKAMFPLEHIPEPFMNQIVNLSLVFMKEQVKVINANILHFQRDLKNEIHRLGVLKQEIANRFMGKYNVRAIDEGRKLVPSGGGNKYRKYLDGVSGYFVSDLIDVVDDLDIILGKRLTTVFFTEFCDNDLLPKAAYANNVDLPAETHLELLRNLDNDLLYYDHKSYVPYSYDNSKYRTVVFNELYRLVKIIRPGENVILVGYLFLTRFDASLLHLLASAFTVIRHFDKGVIALKDCNLNLPETLSRFNEIHRNLTQSHENLSLTVVSILPMNNLFNGVFDLELKRYNTSTIYVLAAMCISHVHKEPFDSVFKSEF